MNSFGQIKKIGKEKFYLSVDNSFKMLYIFTNVTCKID